MDHLPLFFLTDFGLKDIYVGVMKAVATAIGFRGPIIDFTHGIAPQDVAGGALALEDALPYLPEQCVVCCVVDPGVGTKRRAVAVRSAGRFFVGPDNGLLTPAFQGHYSLREIAPGGPIAPQRSATFHGRDVFAPAAALLAMHARRWEDIGPLAYFPRRVEFPPPRVEPDGSVTCTVLASDHFGNLATNLRRNAVPRGVDLRAGEFFLGDHSLGTLRHSYEDVHEGETVVYFNSASRLEVAVRFGNAAQALGASAGTTLTFRPSLPGAG